MAAICGSNGGGFEVKTHMMKAFFGLTAVCFLLISTSFAKTYYVGTCHASSYSTISAAVAVAPPGSIVKVCSGTYPEQVFIMQPLTLEGISSATGDRARITVPIPPTGGPPNWTFVPDPDGPGMVAPQIYANSPAGAVTIENLTIDASLETTAPACGGSGYWYTTAILLENSNGTVKGVNTVGQGKNSGCGIGIWDFMPGTAPATLSLSNSSLQDANWIGLYLEGAGLSVSVKNNVLDLTSGLYGIEINNPSGTISSNFINAPSSILTDSGAEVPITYSGNVLRGATGCGFAITLYRPAQVTGNKIYGCFGGIDLEGSPIAVTIKSNLIVNTGLGINLGCNSTSALAGNTVNNSAIGVTNSPVPISAAQVTFDNVDTVATSACP